MCLYLANIYMRMYFDNIHMRIYFDNIHIRIYYDNIYFNSDYILDNNYNITTQNFGQIYVCNIRYIVYFY